MISDIFDDKYFDRRLSQCINLEKNILCSMAYENINSFLIKKQLIDSLTISIVIEIEELNEKPNKVEKPKDAADIIKEFDEILYAK